MRQKAIIITLALAAIAGGKVQAQEFKRQIEQSTFVPKGQWIAGSSISYSEHTEDNYQFLIIDGFKSDGYTFKVSPLVCYAFKDNIAAGGRFAYSRSLIKIREFDITQNKFSCLSLITLTSMAGFFSKKQ